MVADLATEAGQSEVAQVLADDPTVSVLVNNAGIARLAPLAGGAVSNPRPRYRDGDRRHGLLIAVAIEVALAVALLLVGVAPTEERNKK